MRVQLIAETAGDTDRFWGFEFDDLFRTRPLKLAILVLLLLGDFHLLCLSTCLRLMV